MKFKGKPLAPLGRKTITLKRQGPLDEKGESTFLEIPLQIQALPLGFDERVLNLFPSPIAKLEFAKSKGKVLRDANGGVVRVPQRSNEHQAKVREAQALQAVALLHEGVKYDENLTFGAVQPAAELFADLPKWREFYRAVYVELKGANFTTYELGFICKEVGDLSVNRSKDIDEEVESFS